MKNKFYLLSIALLSYNCIFSQGGNSGNTPADTTAQNSTRWKLNGNSVTTDNFIGTTNQKDLIFKSGGQEGLRITPGKDMKIPGQIYIDLHKPTDLGKENFLTVDYNGKVKSMEKSGLQAALYSSPCYYTISLGGTLPLIHSTWANADAPGYGIIYTGTDCNPARVGIGTDDPDANLHIIGTSHVQNHAGFGAPVDPKTQVFIKPTSSYYNGLIIDHSSTASVVNGVSFQTIVNHDDRKAMSVYNSNSSSDVFLVKGDGSLSSTSVTSHSITGDVSTDTDKAFVVRNSTYTGQSEVFRVYGNGVVWATEVNIKLRNHFPDYVFAPTYKLMPLGDLESYIETNKHLPNVPSAEEVKKDGLNISEIQVKQMEKIEELTLYTIQQQKLIEELQKQLTDLQKKIEEDK